MGIFNTLENFIFNMKFSFQKKEAVDQIVIIFKIIAVATGITKANDSVHLALVV